MAPRRPPQRRLWTRPTAMQRIRRDFLTGLVVVLPAALTVYVVLAVVGFVDRQVMPLVPSAYRPDNVIGVGVVIFLIFTTFVGAIAKGFIGRRIINLGERIVDRTPVVRSIYNALKQIVQTVFSQQSTSFKQACLVQYPRKDVWAVAFLSTEAKGEIPRKAGEDDLVSVFLPSTPNPTTGFLLFVPRRDVAILDMSVEEAAKLIISAGLVTPEDKANRPAPPRRRVAAAE
jgi:uncharacterized membrane protein